MLTFTLALLCFLLLPNNIMDQNHQSLSDQSMALPPLPPITDSSQDWFMGSHVMGIGDFNNIDGANFSQDQHPYTHPQQQLYDPLIIPNNQAPTLGLFSSSSTDLSMEFSQFMSYELDRQTTEMEAFLQLQNQNLNTVLREEARQRGVLLEKYALNLASLIEIKENELALAKQTSMEIEVCMLKTDAEVKAWQKVAMEKETMVAELSYKLKKAQKKIQMMSSAADADSTCGETSQDKGNNNIMHGKCKVCQAQDSCVLLLPCKHLCCCKSCKDVVKLCPVCESFKKESMEIFLA